MSGTAIGGAAMGKALVIVESPAKARTIGGLLGPDFIVESSIGHIRDLPRGADEVPAAYKGEGWARLGVDVDNGFKPLYVVSPEKKSVVANLKKLLKNADELYLATDEDREGESIAWHLSEVLAPQIPVKRMVFHEITPAAIRRAVDDWRELDRRLVDAQEARRILDRLYGYEVSPVLWKKVMPRLSAGRVQSVATRMVVERERARMRFRSATWWGVDGTFAARGGSFGAALVAVDGTTLATGRDFTATGERTSTGTTRVLAEPEARALADGLEDQPFAVRSVTEKPFRRSPAPPFMTSTLQQEAGRKLRFSAQRAMQVAQRLYEQGWITYMRTDSTTLSDEALGAARSQATELYGAEYVPQAPRRYERKVKNAQEAHEAIRPAGDTFRTPEAAGRSLHGDELRLYELIWKRTVASQMADATGTSAQVRLAATMPGDVPQLAGAAVEFSASGRVIAFPGFLRAYVEGEDDPEAELADREVVLPPLVEGDAVDPVTFEPGSHTTQPPARYTEASLGQGHGGARRRPAVDVRQRHRHHPRPWLRLEEGLRPRTELHRVRGRRAARALLRRSRRLRLHRGHGERPGRDRRRPRGGTAVAQPVLLRRRHPAWSHPAWRWPELPTGGWHEHSAGGWQEHDRAGAEDGGRHPPRRHRRPGDQLDRHRDRRRRPGNRRPRRPVRAVPAARRRPSVDPRRHRAGRADGRAGRGAAGRAVRRPRSSATTPVPGCPSTSRPAGSVRTFSSARSSTVARSRGRRRSSPR